VDRCVIYLPSADGRTIGATYTWARGGRSIATDAFDASVELPWLVAKARAGDAVSAPTIVDLPSAADRESMRRFGAQSCLAAPVVLDGALGLIVADAAVEREWPSELVETLRLVGAVMGQALVRRREHARNESSRD